MNKGQTVLSQIIDFLPKNKFRHCVNRYSGNHRVRPLLIESPPAYIRPMTG